MARRRRPALPVALPLALALSALFLGAQLRAAGAAAVAVARSPSAPAPLTGRVGCLNAIKYLTCTRDDRSKFVAGIGQSLGEGFGVKQVCSGGGAATYGSAFGRPYQTTFDMSVPSGPAFPKGPSGAPDLRYLLPYGSLITQVIVLQAPNPFGAPFGTVPAVIFLYLTDDDSLGWAACGDADYASFYMNPGQRRPPATPATLKAVYTNPLSDTEPARFLGSFDGKCYMMGRGFLGGDPNMSSKYHLLGLSKVCFAPVAPFVKSPTIVPPPPAARIQGDWDPKADSYRPCFWGKSQAKTGMPSMSCILSGYAVATGKYGVLTFDQLTGETHDWAVDAQGHVEAAPYAGAEPYRGSDPDEAAT